MHGRLLSATALILAAAPAAYAGTVVTRPNNPDPVTTTFFAQFGQTFLADDVQLASSSFHANRNGGFSYTLVGDVFATSGGLPAAPALYASGPVAVGLVPGGADYFFSPSLVPTVGTTDAIVARSTTTNEFTGYGPNEYASGNAVFSQNGGAAWANANVRLEADIELTTQMMIAAPPPPPPVVNPEPATWALFGLGLLGLGSAVRRRRASGHAPREQKTGHSSRSPASPTPGTRPAAWPERDLGAR